MTYDLICRRAAVNTVLSMFCKWDTEDTNDLRDMLLLAFQELPTVDAVSVVRCKDCIFWDAFPSSSIAPEFHKCKGLGVHTVADFFCSKGERINE